jgi:transcriptional regulator with AAA-type ATPase domain
METPAPAAFRPVPESTYALAEELDQERTKMWRALPLGDDVLDAIARDLVQRVEGLDGIELPLEAHARARRMVRALQFFWEATRNRTVGLYGRDFVRELCHAVFGANVRLRLFTADTPARRILIFGETGVGKERIARLLADTLRELETGGASPSPAVPRTRYVSVNVAAISGSLADAELFGHAPGAYTGSIGERSGLFGEVADGGTVFLDEIGEADPNVQSRLLRVIQSGEYRRVGSDRARTDRFHVIAATNRREEDARSGQGIRRDLYYRLACPAITVPPLRATLATEHPPRRLIFDLLIEHVVEERLLGSTHQGERDSGKRWVDTWNKKLARELMERTAGYDWPGNLRECTGLIEDIVYQGIDRAPELCARLIAKQPQRRSARRGQGDAGLSLQEALLEEERRRYADASSSAKTIDDVAELLGVARQTASRRLKHFGLRLGAAPARDRGRATPT